ncbi:MAG: hypothetical protein AABZ46_02810, partial [Nitrospirota bacterium]
IDETLTDTVVVTVIATGFDHYMQVPVAVGAGRGRNEHQHENQDDNQIDTPAFTRKFGTTNFRNEAIGINNDDWDMPAFLRKKAT